MQNDKQALRKDLLKKRRKLSKRELEKRSFQVMHMVKSLIRKNDRVLMFYVPINNEVDLLPLAADLCETDRTIVFPKMVNDSVVPYVVRDFYNDFKPGAYNIPEPDTRPYKGPIDIVFVPGVVFGRNGYRVGYGKGYYDRFLSGTEAGKCVGVCFDFQLLKAAPFTERDHRMDFIQTEEETLNFPKE
jgi:5-formyltetrahydrofolate cyclo-ligase